MTTSVRRSSCLASALLVVAALAVLSPSVPAVAAAPAGAPGPLSGRVVALDPGHNIGNALHLAQIERPVFVGNGTKPCNTTGTATNAGYPESTFTLGVALALRADLEALGARVAMTRDVEDRSTWGPCVDARGRFGRSAGAELMVSLHGDGAASALHGFHVIRPGLLPGYTDDIYLASQRLQDDVRDGLHDRGFPYADYYGGTGAVERTDLGTLNMSDVPVVMTELGNMRNPGDAALMTSPAGQASLAAGLAAGIERFLLDAPCDPGPLVQGLIRERYVSLAGPCGFLGRAVTPELATPNRFGRYNHFDGGSIYWSPPTGAWEVHGAIRDAWSATGWENGLLGFPRSNETRTATRPGAFNVFEGGSLYWSPATGAHEVHGEILQRWAALGWENGLLGFPTSDEQPAPGGRRSLFEHGDISWTPGGGSVVHLRP